MKTCDNFKKTELFAFGPINSGGGLILPLESFSPSKINPKSTSRSMGDPGP